MEDLNYRNTSLAQGHHISSRNDAFKNLAFIFFFIILGLIFLYDNFTGKLESSVSELKKEMRSLSSVTSIVSSELKFPYTLYLNEIDNKTIDKYNLKSVSNLITGVNIQDLSLANHDTKVEAQSENWAYDNKEYISKYLEAYYYLVISFNEKPIKVVESVCFNKIKSLGKENLKIPSGLIVATSSNKFETIPITSASYSLGNYSVGSYQKKTKTEKKDIQADTEGIWDVSLCNNMDTNTVIIIKQLLKDKSYKVSSSKTWDKTDDIALIAFQKDNNLPEGGINFKTLKELGLQIFVGQKEPFQRITTSKESLYIGKDKE